MFQNNKAIHYSNHDVIVLKQDKIGYNNNNLLLNKVKNRQCLALF